MNTQTTTHTPGPWHVGHVHQRWIEIWDAPADHTRAILATVINSDNIDATVPSPKQEANARLIAAAPELLEAAENLLDVVGVRIDDPRIAQFDALRAAIAKAKGE